MTTPPTVTQHLEDASLSVRRNPVATGQPTFETYVSAMLTSTDATYAPTSRIVALSSTRRNIYDNTPTAPTLTTPVTFTRNR